MGRVAGTKLLDLVHGHPPGLRWWGLVTGVVFLAREKDQSLCNIMMLETILPINRPSTGSQDI